MGSLQSSVTIAHDMVSTTLFTTLCLVTQGGPSSSCQVSLPRPPSRFCSLGRCWHAHWVVGGAPVAALSWQLPAARPVITIYMQNCREIAVADERCGRGVVVSTPCRGSFVRSGLLSLRTPSLLQTPCSRTRSRAGSCPFYIVSGECGLRGCGRGCGTSAHACPVCAWWGFPTKGRHGPRGAFD